MVNLISKNGSMFYIPQFFTNEESQSILDDLTKQIEWRQDSIKMYGKTINLPRLTAWYGDGKSYSYSGINMNPIPFTKLLSVIKDKVEKITEQKYNSVLLNYYRNGNDSVSWHQDDEPELGKNPTIASISFGSERIFKVRHCYDKIEKNLLLQTGSLLIMRDEMQHYWRHSIPKTKRNVGARINLTFRNLSV